MTDNFDNSVSVRHSLLPYTSLFPSPVYLGQNNATRELKHSKTKLKVPRSIACAESKFPDACSLLSANVLSHLKLTPGQFPQGPTQEKTEENTDALTRGRGI